MTTPADKALHAYMNDALPDLLEGTGSYYEEEEYMAPSNVPTNWSKAIEGLDVVAKSFPDLPQRLEAALIAMGSNADGMYCALATLLAYLRLRSGSWVSFILDQHRISKALAAQIPSIRSAAHSLHRDWMGPTSETLWDRITRVTEVLEDDFTIKVI